MILTNLFDHFYVFLRVAFAFLTALRVSVLKLLSYTFVTSRGNLDVLEGGRKRKYFSAPKFTAKDLAICKCCDQAREASGGFSTRSCCLYVHAGTCVFMKLISCLKKKERKEKRQK